MNHEKRERRTNEKIVSAITKLDPCAEVCVELSRDSEIMQKAIEFCPDIIMTFPFTSQKNALRYYILKYLLNCHVVCFRAEGLIDIENDNQVAEMSGMDRYGRELVDYEIFWGRKAAERVGKVLVEAGKLSSIAKARYFGNPFFEDYTNPVDESCFSLPEDIASRVRKYPRDKIFGVVSGFHFAEYSDRDIVGAGDLVDMNSKTLEADIRAMQDLIGRTRRFRQKWIDVVTMMAGRHPETLFIFKIHPIENIVHRDRNIEPYAAFKDYENIVLITETIPFRSMVNHCGILLHYGSTTSLEAYLSKVPTVYVKSIELNFGTETSSQLEFSDMGVPSTLKVDIEELPSVIERHLSQPIGFERNSKTERFFEEMLDLEIGRDYRPSEKMAGFLLSLNNEAPQSILSDNQYLPEALKLHNMGNRLIGYLFERAVARIKSNEFKGLLGGCLHELTLLAEAMKVQIPKLQYLRSLCFLKMGLVDNAMASIRQELVLCPDDRDSIQLYNLVRSKLQNTTDLQKTWGQNGCEDYVQSNGFNCQKELQGVGGGACDLGRNHQVHMSDQGQPEVLFEKAVTLLRQKNFAESFKIMESLTSSNVRMPGLYFAKAIALSGMERFGMAEFACRAELELYPGNVQAENFLKQLQNFAGNGLIVRSSGKPFANLFGKG